MGFQTEKLLLLETFNFEIQKKNIFQSWKIKWNWWPNGPNHGGIKLFFRLLTLNTETFCLLVSAQFERWSIPNSTHLVFGFYPRKNSSHFQESTGAIHWKMCDCPIYYIPNTQQHSTWLCFFISKNWNTFLSFSHAFTPQIFVVICNVFNDSVFMWRSNFSPCTQSTKVR